MRSLLGRPNHYFQEEMIGEGIKNSPPLAPKPRNWRQSAGLQESEEAITEKIDLTEFEETKD